MRYHILVSLLLAALVGHAQTQPSPAPTTATQQDSIPRITEPVSLQPYEGQRVTVEGRIVKVKFSPNSKNRPTFLDMHSGFPNTPFSLTVFERDAVRFPPLKETYEGKILAVTGMVKGFESVDRTGKKTIRMGITIESPDQVKVVE